MEVATSPARSLDVLLAARAGSHEAGHRLLIEHGPSMLRSAWSVLGRYGSQEAEDVVQEAFIAALTTDALPHGDLGAWLRAITVRKSLDALRAMNRRSEQSGSSTDSEARPELADSSEPTPVSTSVMATRLDEVLAVREALGTLSPTERAVLVLVDLEGFSMAEAASMLGSTSVAVRLRAMRARRRLAGILRSGPVGRDHE